MNNFLHILDKLGEEFDGEFCITSHVKNEVVNNPLKIKRFELEALNILSLIKRGIIEVKESKDLEKEVQKMKISLNSLFVTNNQKLKLFHDGEVSCFALANQLIKEGHEVLLIIDERTARMVIENQENLRKLLEDKLHTKVDTRKINLNFIKGLKVVRSAELGLVAYKQGFIELPASKDQAIEAILYSLKYKGCSISHIEIEEAKKLF